MSPQYEKNVVVYVVKCLLNYAQTAVVVLQVTEPVSSYHTKLSKKTYRLYSVI